MGLSSVHNGILRSRGRRERGSDVRNVDTVALRKIEIALQAGGCSLPLSNWALAEAPPAAATSAIRACSARRRARVCGGKTPSS
jgi:hypothetical protein